MTEYKKLKPEFKELWLKALRSDKFEQTTGYLMNTEKLMEGNSDRQEHPVGYCCLGVACEVTRSMSGAPNVDNALTSRQMPTRDQRRFWGLDEHLAKTLSEMNDEGSRFDEIADWIEENL